MNEDRALIQMFQLSLSLGNCVVSWASAGALCKPSRTASASMSVISRSYPKNVLLSSSSLIRRRTSVPRVYNARRCLKRSTVDTPARHCVPVCHCVLVLLPIPCANSWELSAKVDVEVVVHDMIYLAHDNLHAACWFSHSKGINSSSKYGWQQNKPFPPDHPFAQISNFVASPQRSDVAACSARRCWPCRPRSPPLPLIVDRQRSLQRLL